MKRCVDTYLVEDRTYRVLDLGSLINKGQRLHHRLIFTGIDCRITGVDVLAGPNVDIVMRRPYSIPVATSSQDVVVSGQAFEHIPFPFASMLEIARVLRPGGYLFITAPSRGHQHYPYDGWRYYPDSMRALAKYAELELLEAHVAWPTIKNGRFDYSSIPREEYWGDAVGVFRKPAWRPSVRRALYRAIVRGWANHLRGVDDVKRTGGAPTPQERAKDRRKLAELLAASGR
jgi:SAM-dependent methyltransferase